jgi:hypothetical protein
MSPFLAAALLAAAALPIGLGAPAARAAELANAYAESLGRSTTTSTTVGGANKVRLTHTPGDNETWAYLWNVELDGSSASVAPLLRLRNETLAADWANVTSMPQDATNRVSVGGLKVHTYGAAPGAQDIDIDFWNGAAATAGATDAHIFGLKLGADDKSAAADAANGNTSGTYETAVTLAETLDGDYLFLGSCEYNSANTTGDVQIRADKGGTKYGTLWATVQASTNWRTWATGFKLTGLSGAQTVTIEFASHDTVTNVQVRNCRILALDLSRSNKHGYDEDLVRDTNTTATPEDQSSLTFSPDAERNHVALAGMIYEFERDGAAINQAQEEPNEAVDGMAFFSLRRESLTTGDKVYKTQKWSETTNTTGAAESWIVVLDLEEAGGGGGGPALNANPAGLLGVGRKLP